MNKKLKTRTLWLIGIVIAVSIIWTVYLPSPTNDTLADRLETIKENFKRINSIKNWTLIEQKDLWETTEGGEATFYYMNEQLERIITLHFGETFQSQTEYYLLNGQLSFVFNRFYKYNLPIYFDSTLSKEYDLTEVFDFEKSEITESKSYFTDGKLLHQTGNHNFNSEKGVKEYFEKLIKLTTEK